MNSDDSDHSEILTDLAILQLRYRQADTKLLLNVKTATPMKPRRASSAEWMLDSLNRAIFDKDAGRISALELGQIRAKVNAGIKMNR